jgi:hypothetical protein
MDKLADLKHLGLGADGLLAAGLTVSQASSVLDWIGTDRTRFDAIRIAQIQLRTAQQDLDAIRSEMVRVGRTDALETQHSDAQGQLAAATANYDGLVAQARAALGVLVVEELDAAAVWPVLSRVISNRDRQVPTSFRVLQLSPSEWEQLELYHEMFEDRPEAVDAAAVALAESLAISTVVTSAQVRIDDGVAPLIQTLLAAE